MREAREHLIAVRDPLIDARIELILVVGLVCGPAIVVGRPRRGGLRIPLEQRQRHGIEAVGRDGAVRERCAREPAAPVGHGRAGIVNNRHAAGDRLGEDSLSLQQRRHRRDHGPADALPLTLVIDEEERPVATERAAQDAAELVPAEVGLGGGRRKDIARVQPFVAEEVERGSMEDVGAGLRRQVDDATVEPAELGRRAVRFDLEFLDGVDDREERDLARLRLHHRDAIEQIFVGARPAAVDSRELRCRRQSDARRERCQRDEAPPVERQRDDLFLRYDLAEAPGGAPQHRRVSGDDERFGDLADRQREVQRDRLAGLDPDAFTADRLEPHQLDANAVQTWWQAGQRIDARRARDRPSRYRRVHMYRGDRRARNGRAAGVGDRSGQLARTHLGTSGARHRHEQTRQHPNGNPSHPPAPRHGA